VTVNWLAFLLCVWEAPGFYNGLQARYADSESLYIRVSHDCLPPYSSLFIILNHPAI